MPIITLADFPEIRAALDPTLDASNLPDSVIDLDIYRGRAEEWVISRNPAAASYAGAVDGYSRAMRRAAVLATAAYLAVNPPQLLTETFGQKYSYRRAEVKTQDLAADLWAAANDQITLSLPPDAATPNYGGMRPFFVTATGRRGQ